MHRRGAAAVAMTGVRRRKERTTLVRHLLPQRASTTEKPRCVYRLRRMAPLVLTTPVSVADSEGPARLAPRTLSSVDRHFPGPPCGVASTLRRGAAAASAATASAASTSWRAPWPDPHSAKAPDHQTRIQVSENASIAVEIRFPATSRGIGAPGRTTPFTVTVARSQPTNRVGM